MQGMTTCPSDADALYLISAYAALKIGISQLRQTLALELRSYSKDEEFFVYYTIV
jgi:hypothetical protein